MRHIKAVFSLALLSSIFIQPAFAQVGTFGFTLEANGVKAEVIIGEAANESELQTSIEGLAHEIRQEHDQNPNAFFEAGWMDLDESGRVPAQFRKIVSRSQKFITDLTQKLKSQNVEADRVAGIKLPAARVAQKDSWYLDHSKLVWTVVRVTNSTGFRVGSLVFAGLSPLHAVELSSTLAFACTLSAAFYIPINHFSNKVRFYNYLDLNRHPKLKNLLSNPTYADRIDRIHGKVSWGLVEVGFGSLVVLGENFARKILGLPIELPTLLQFGASTGLAIATQQVWDRAVGKYEDLQNLLHEQAGGHLQDPLFLKQRNADVHKRGAIGSILSVVGFSWSSSQNPIIQVAGYATLGTLGVAGHIYDRRIGAKLARTMSQINACNTVLGGKLPDNLDQAG